MEDASMDARTSALKRAQEALAAAGVGTWAGVPDTPSAAANCVPCQGVYCDEALEVQAGWLLAGKVLDR